MKNIFEAIREDHDRHRALLEQLVNTSGASEEREKLYQKVKHELEIHAAIEERHFYIPLMKIDKTQDHARHGVHEHHEIDELIEKLEESAMDEGAWLIHAKALREQVEHHLKDEEHTIFQLAGKVMDESEKTKLAKAYLNERDQRMNESAHLETL